MSQYKNTRLGCIDLNGPLIFIPEVLGLQQRFFKNPVPHEVVTDLNLSYDCKNVVLRMREVIRLNRQFSLYVNQRVYILKVRNGLYKILLRNFMQLFF